MKQGAVREVEMYDQTLRFLEEVKNDQLTLSQRARSHLMSQLMECHDLVCCFNDAWAVFMDGLQKSIRMLDDKLPETEQMSSQVAGEWVVAIELVMNYVENFNFSNTKSLRTSEAYSQRLKNLRHRLQEHYVRFKSIKEAKEMPTGSSAT